MYTAQIVIDSKEKRSGVQLIYHLKQFPANNFIFEKIIVAGRVKLLAIFTILLTAILVLVSTIALATGFTSVYQTAIVYAYMILTIFLGFIILFFTDAFESHKFKDLLNTSTTQVRYAKKESGLTKAEKQFEFNESTLRLLNKLIFNGPQNFSKKTAGDIAGIKRSSAADLLKKLELNGIISKKKDGKYYFAGITFKVLHKKGKQLISAENVDQAYFTYLFRVLCFTYGQ